MLFATGCCVLMCLVVFGCSFIVFDLFGGLGSGWGSGFDSGLFVGSCGLRLVGLLSCLFSSVC